ncbi:MAG TPA: hypothetical protein VGH42_14470 [Verrucomicrobiae bacterium]|jgi:hypothetical protein
MPSLALASIFLARNLFCTKYGFIMNSGLADLLARIRQNLRDGVYDNERVIEARVILPILRDLGWDENDPRIIAQQYSAIPGWRAKKVDFALLPERNNQRPSVFIEAKSHPSLKDSSVLTAAEDQLSEYESYYRVAVAIITDGEIWNFYSPSAGGTYSDRLAASINLLNTPDDQIFQTLTQLLSFDAVKSGAASAAVKDLHARRVNEKEMRGDFARVWHDLLDEPSETLILSVQEEFKKKTNHSPTTDQVRELFKTLVQDADLEEIETVSPFSDDVLEGDELIGGNSAHTKIRVTLNWKLAGKNKESEIICRGDGAVTLVEVVKVLVRELGTQVIPKLGRFNVRKLPFVSKIRSNKYQQNDLGIGGYLVVTHSSSSDKGRILDKVCDALGFRRDFIKTEIIPK